MLDGPNRRLGYPARCSIIDEVFQFEERFVFSSLQNPPHHNLQGSPLEYYKGYQLKQICGFPHCLTHVLVEEEHKEESSWKSHNHRLRSHEAFWMLLRVLFLVEEEVRMGGTNILIVFFFLFTLE